MSDAAAVSPLLRVSDIQKSFPGVHALRGVSLTLRRGEVLGLMGENGAGKSTLIRVLSGAHQPDAGRIEIDQQLITLPDPAAAIRAGIGVIYQELNLIPALTAWENIFLGREGRIGLVAGREERRRAAELFGQMGVRIPLDVPCRRLSVAQQQLVEIARTLAQDVRILIMDEPSAALTPQEVQRLFGIISELRSRGIGIIYVSHRLDEIFHICDRITVFRDGAHVADHRTEELSRRRLVELMVGRSIDNEFPRQRCEIGPVRLSVSGLVRVPGVRDVSLQVHRGEILGITGLVGAGRTETVRLIAGADRAEAGQICLDGKPLKIRHPSDALRAGICLLTEDRKSQGLVLGRSVLENFSLPNLSQFSCWGFVRGKAERSAFAGFVKTLKIRIPHEHQLAKNLSGGNQQKVVLAKWLQQNAEIIIFDEPTRGIDVGARQEIYLLMNQLAAQGKAIIMVSSELPEVLGMSDRVLVMHEGRVTGELTDPAAATQEEVLQLAVG